MQWHDVTRKILGGALGEPGKNLGGSGPPWHPLVAPLPAGPRKIIKANDIVTQ